MNDYHNDDILWKYTDDLGHGEYTFSNQSATIHKADTEAIATPPLVEQLG